MKEKIERRKGGNGMEGRRCREGEKGSTKLKVQKSAFLFCNPIITNQATFLVRNELTKR